MKNSLTRIPAEATLLLGVLVIFSGCDLAIQDTFEFKDELGPLVSFEDQTAWEWLQTQTTPTTDTALNGEKFDYLLQAVELAGLVDEYNQTATRDRTYLLLNNDAFVGDEGIINVVTGSTESNLANADVATLTALLRYHIVDAYVDQVPTLYEYGVDYKFQTLNPGADGEIYFRRDPRYNIDINESPLLPSSRIAAGVRNYNYVFKNGIGHHLADYVRNVPF